MGNHTLQAHRALHPTGPVCPHDRQSQVPTWLSDLLSHVLYHMLNKQSALQPHMYPLRYHLVGFEIYQMSLHV